MTALSAPRATITADDHVLPMYDSWPVATGVTIWAGGMVGLNAAGYAIPAATTAIRVIGVADETVVNAGANGAVEVKVKRGRFLLANKAGDLVTLADTAVVPAAASPQGAPCYVDDDNTVRHTAAATIIAGRAIRVETAGVWVEII